MTPPAKLFLIFYMVSFFGYEVDAQYHQDAILLGDVKALTLKKGHYTSYRRGSPMPQLQCVGGSAGCHSVTPDVVQCSNVGFDGTDYQWECKADLDKKYRFGSVVVSCEGFNHPQDPYILRGSCGLEYSLELTGSSYGHHNHHHQNQHTSYHKDTKGNDGISSLIFIILGVGIIIGIYWFATSQQTPSTGGPPPPPPPYGFTDHTSRPPPYGSDNQSPPPYGFKQDYSGQSRQSNNQGGLGGFWTGAGVGGLAGYLFGSRNNRHTHHHAPSSGSSFWGGSTNYGPSSSGEFFSGSSASPSETRTASGFGGTKRR